MPGRRGAGAAQDGAELRERILAATRQLLADQRFDTLSVADILAAANVSRASFYFYFPSKQAVLGELVSAAVAGGREAAGPFLEEDSDPIGSLRAGVRDGARLWRENAGVLTAIVEAWGSDESLRGQWLAHMAMFTDAAAARIAADPRAVAYLGEQNVRATAAGLTWTGERLYYLAAAGVAPFDDEQVLIDVLLHAWTSTLYGQAGR